jgi:uncharacterized membrane protein
MNWKFYCAYTIVLYTLHDFLLKCLSKQIPPAIASLVVNIFAAVGILLFMWRPIYLQSKNILNLSLNQLGLLFLTGSCLGIATVCFMKVFELGGEFSVAVPIVYTSIIVLSLILGTAFLQEEINWQKLTGVLLSAIGIFLIFKT